MLKTIIEVILALATAIGGISAIDYFCNGCVKNFFWNHSSLFIYGLIISIALLVIVVTTVYFLRKWQLNQYDIEESEGQVPLNSPFYIERPPIEADCYRTILKPDALIRIKAPRQMGKSSLMTRILHHAHQHDSRTICISFEEAESTVFTNLDQFLQWLCQTVTDQLELPPDKFTDFWQNSTLNIKRRCGKYFEKHLFTEITQPLVLGLDEVDRVFDTAIASDFFGLLRAWHEKGKYDEAWQNFRLVITHSQEVYISLDINQSPFNVGISIELPEFNREQVQTILQRHKLTWTDAQIDQLMATVGGHPYLVRIAIYKIARRDISLEKLLKTAANLNGPYAAYLRRHLDNLEKHPQLAATLKTVVTTDKPVPVKELGKGSFQLCGMGLIRIDDGDMAKPSCELYRCYFSKHL
jgi:hypothetical protein